MADFPDSGPDISFSGSGCKPVRSDHCPERGILWGLHTVAAALSNPVRSVSEALLTRNAARRMGLDPEALCEPALLVDTGRITAVVPEAAIHQGVCARVFALPLLSLEEAAQFSGPLLVLDGITDPQNIGAIFRVAAAFGVMAIVMQTRGAPLLFGAAAKAAAGAVECVSEVRVVNIARSLRYLLQTGWHVVGLSGRGDMGLRQALCGVEKLVLVLGSEGKGLRVGVGKSCSCLARIELSEAMPSLNVSGAAAIALYEASGDSGLGSEFSS